MALKYEVRYDNVAKIGDKEIKFKPWTTKNEKDYLIAVESEENITDTMLFELLIRPCLENPDIILSTDEQKLLMIEIRKKSLGYTFPMRFVCSSCSNVNDIDINLDDIIEYKPPKYEDIILNNITFKFGDIPSNNIKKKLELTNSNVEKSFVDMLIHINSIIIDGVEEDSFTFEELKQFVENLPSYIFDELFEKYSKMKSSLEFKYEANCMICNNKNQIDFDHIPNFLWT